jgi:glycerate 2-kinase
MIPRTVLIAPRAFEELSAQRVASAIGGGVRAGGWSTDLCPIAAERDSPVPVAALLDALDFDARMRPARAVILGEWRLTARPPAHSATFEIATRARQAGVPVYAVAGESMLTRFDARIFDVQAVLEASSARALGAAGRRLAGLI